MLRLHQQLKRTACWLSRAVRCLLLAPLPDSILVGKDVDAPVMVCQIVEKWPEMIRPGSAWVIWRDPSRCQINVLHPFLFELLYRQGDILRASDIVGPEAVDIYGAAQFQWRIEVQPGCLKEVVSGFGVLHQPGKLFVVLL